MLLDRTAGLETKAALLPYDAIWDFQPLATGTAILVAAVVTSFVERLPLAAFFRCVSGTWRQSRIAILTVVLITGLAYLMNYSGLNYTLRLRASVGPAFVFLSPFLGWAAVLLSGSDTSGNALFGNLQVVAAQQLKLDPILLAATNSAGGVMGKMISPQISRPALRSQHSKVTKVPSSCVRFRMASC